MLALRSERCQFVPGLNAVHAQRRHLREQRWTRWHTRGAASRASGPASRQAGRVQRTLSVRARLAGQRAFGPPRRAALAQHLLQQRQRAKFLDQAAVERDLVQAVQDFGGAGRDDFATRRVDLHKQEVVCRAFGDERQQRRVAEVAAVPVGLAVDLDRPKQQRQAGRRHHRVGRQLGLPEFLQPTGAHVGGGDEQTHLVAGAHPFEIDFGSNDVAQRVEV